MRAGTALLGLVVAGCSSARRPEAPPPRPTAPAPLTAAAGGEPLTPEATPAAPPPEAPAEPTGPVETVTIKVIADPHREAHVFWGRKDLGPAPVEIERRRGSGPLDLLVIAPGYLPLHTRVFTDHDESLPLRLYTAKDATGLLGWTDPERAAPTGSRNTAGAGFLKHSVRGL